MLHGDGLVTAVVLLVIIQPELAAVVTPAHQIYRPRHEIAIYPCDAKQIPPLQSLLPLCVPSSLGAQSPSPKLVLAITFVTCFASPRPQGSDTVQQSRPPKFLPLHFWPSGGSRGSPGRLKYQELLKCWKLPIILTLAWLLSQCSLSSRSSHPSHGSRGQTSSCSCCSHTPDLPENVLII